MNYKEFYEASQNLKEFIKQTSKLENFFKKMHPLPYLIEWLDQNIDDYIKVVEIALGDKGHHFDWFVWELEFGKDTIPIDYNGIEYIITNEKEFYDFIKIRYPEK